MDGTVANTAQHAAGVAAYFLRHQSKVKDYGLFGFCGSGTDVIVALIFGLNVVAFDIRQSQVDATLERISRLQGAFNKYGEDFDAMRYLEHEMFFAFRHPKNIVAEARQELLSEIEKNNGDAVESDNEDDFSAALGDAAALEDSTDRHEWNSLKESVSLWWNFSKRADHSQGDGPPGSQKWVAPMAEAKRIRDRLGLGLPIDE